MLLANWDADVGVECEEGIDRGEMEKEVVDTGDSGVSLHALNGKSGPNTFKIKGYVGKK